MQQQLWGYKVEDKLHLGYANRKRLNTTGVQLKQTYLLPLVLIYTLVYLIAFYSLHLWPENMKIKIYQYIKFCL
jgi:hypothetical protein